MLAEEAVDKSDEIFDYATSKPYVQAWSDGFKKLTDGKSAGNLRAMHTSIAAGKFLDVQLDDAAKKVPVSFKVVDAGEREKCAEGVYTGLSIGGKYVKRWKDEATGKTRYTADLAEGSLVDNPCMYGATFEFVRSAGAAPELRKFKGGASATETPAVEPAPVVEKVAAREDVSPKEGKSEYGDVTFADPTNKKYPIDTAAHIRAAWNYINKQKNADKYSPKDRATIKRKIINAWKSKIDKDGPPSAEKSAASELEKASFWNVQSLGCILDSLSMLLGNLEMAFGMDRAKPEDQPAIDSLKAAAQSLGDALTTIVDNALGELTGSYSEDTGDMAAAAPVGELKKDAPATDPKPPEPVKTEASVDVAAIVKATATELLAGINEAIEKQITTHVVKALEPLTQIPQSVEGSIQKAVGETVKGAVETAAGELRKGIEDLDKRVKVCEDRPAQAGSPVRRVEKAIGAGAPVEGKPSVEAMQKFLDAARKSGKVSQEAMTELTLFAAQQVMP